MSPLMKKKLLENLSILIWSSQQQLESFSLRTSSLFCQEPEWLRWSRSVGYFCSSYFSVFSVIFSKEQGHYVAASSYLKDEETLNIFKIFFKALAGVGQLVGVSSHNWKGTGSIPSPGRHGRQPVDVPLSPFLSLSKKAMKKMSSVRGKKIFFKVKDWVSKFLVRNSNDENPGTSKSSVGKRHLLPHSPRGSFWTLKVLSNHWQKWNKSSTPQSHATDP